MLLLACGPGLEDGTQAGWTCVDALANNFVHVNEGRATLCFNNTHACAKGSGEDLGLYIVGVSTRLREPRPDYFELGRCP